MSVIIEDENGWGVSFTSHNPEAEDFIQCASYEDAERLHNYLEKDIKMKDCIFQYATEDGVILENTDLVTRADAEELWQKYAPQFKQHVSEGKIPEMAIWVDMENKDDFRKTCAHWCGQDFEVRAGKMYSVAAVA